MKNILISRLTSKLRLWIISAVGFALVLGCTTASLRPGGSTLTAKAPGEISIMNFNVENLFDTVHDENRDDHTYLPLSQKNTPEHKAVCAKMENTFYRDECMTLDWSEEVVQVKLKNLAQIILGVDGNGPDVLIVEEVENERILSRLNKEHLAKAGYQTVVLIEGPDTRGIDIGLLSRFPVVGKPQLHRIPFVAKNESDKKGMDRSRGILEVTLKLPTGENLTVFGAHFPSQSNPSYWREQAVNFLSGLIKDRSAKGMVVAGGDLNISHDEEAEKNYFHKNFSEVAMVSHLVGCKDCLGSHSYRKTWSFLDALLFSKNMSETGDAAYKLDANSIQVINADPIHRWGVYPKRFKPEAKEGVADHFPIYARLVPRKK